MGQWTTRHQARGQKIAADVDSRPSDVAPTAMWTGHEPEDCDGQRLKAKHAVPAAILTGHASCSVAVTASSGDDSGLGHVLVVV